MNAVFELYIRQFPKGSQRFCFTRGQIVPQNSSAVAETISIHSIWFVAREQQDFFSDLYCCMKLNISLRNINFKDR